MIEKVKLYNGITLKKTVGNISQLSQPILIQSLKE